MLWRLMKWEIKETYLVCLILCVLAGLTAAVNTDPFAVNETAFFLLLTVAFLFAGWLFLFFWRYYDSIYRRRGYLTHTLPVSGKETVLAKFLISIFWSLIAGGILWGMLYLVTGKNPFTPVFRVSEGMTMTIKALGIEKAVSVEEFPVGIYCIGYGIYFSSILARSYFSISLGQLVPKGKVLAAVLLFVGLKKIQEIVHHRIGGNEWILAHLSVEALYGLAALLFLLFLLLYLTGAIYLVSRKKNLE